MKILVLGGHGFAGRNFMELARGAGHEVGVASRRDGVDLRRYEDATRAFSEARPEVVVNLAANVGSLNYVHEKAATVFDDNMRMLLNVFRALREVLPGALLVTPIANCAYPGDMELYREEGLWLGAIHPSVLSYGSTRRMIEVLTECYRIEHGIRALNFFVPNMYGEYDSTDPNKAHALNALIGKFVKAVKEGWKAVEVWGSGRPIREWLYAKDFARIVLETLERLDWHLEASTVNIGQKNGLTVKELVDIIRSQSGFTGKVIWRTEMSDGAPVKIMDDIHFRKRYPNFRFASLEDGIVATIRYYQSIYPY